MSAYSWSSLYITCVIGRNGISMQKGEALTEAGMAISLVRCGGGADGWRRDRDSNPGYLAVYTLSKRAPSATRPSLQSLGDLDQVTTAKTHDFRLAGSVRRVDKLRTKSAGKMCRLRRAPASPARRAAPRNCPAYLCGWLRRQSADRAGRTAAWKALRARSGV